MKIIYLHQYFKFPNEYGGTRSYDLATSFAKVGYEIFVVTSTSDNKYNTTKRWTTIERDGIKVSYIYLPYSNNMSYLQRIWIFFKFLLYSSFYLLKLRADVVLATSTPLTIGIPSLIKKWFGKTPFIFEVRDVWPEAVVAIGVIKNKILIKLFYCLEKLIYKNAEAIIPLSTDMQRSIVTRYPQFKGKAQIVIENISEINRFQNAIDKINLEEIIGFKPRFSVLYAGTFGKVNGINKFIELAERTLSLDKHLVFILIGSGGEKENVTQIAKEKGVINKNVFILNSISKEELTIWYNSVSMGSSFVIDIEELWANSANKFFDTLAAGKPILINYEGWQAEIIRSYKIGYVLPRKINHENAINFVKFTQDYLKIEEYAKNALKLAISKYSLEKATRSYIKIFNNIKT